MVQFIKKGCEIMFFSNDNLIFSITEVFLVSRKNETIFTSNKPTHCIGYRLEGMAEFYKDGKTLTARRGDVVYVPPYLKYHQKAYNEKVVAVRFECDHKGRELDLISVRDVKRADEKFLKIFEIWNSEKPGYRYAATALLYEIFSDIQSESYKQSPEKEKYQFQINNAIEYMRCNYFKKDLTIKQLADMSNISEVYFRKVFAKIFDTSPLKYINDLRISKAMAMLKSDNTAIKNVASDVGFSDPLYFSRVFKETVGMTPSEFREKG